MKHENFYKKLRQRLLDYSKKDGKENLWIKYLLMAPDLFYLLCGLMADDRVDAESKAKLGLAITYFINPIDFIPDFLISVGYLDDIVVAAYVISSVLKYVSASVANEHWPAKRDITEVVCDINAASEKIIAKDIVDKISALFGSQP